MRYLYEGFFEAMSDLLEEVVAMIVRLLDAAHRGFRSVSGR